jgi:hypothetical protein
MAELFTRKEDTDPNESVRRTERHRAGEWLWFGVLSLLLLTVTVGALSAAAAVSPAFCATCHREAATALSQSSHQTLDCDTCHRSEGALGLVENRLWVAGMVIEAPLRAIFPSGAGASIDSRRCLSCHAAQMSVTTVRNGIRMNHQAPVKEDWSCQRCHRAVGHPPEGVSVATYTMGTCLECHSTGPDNLASCQTCHPEGESASAPRAVPTAWGVTHGENWQQTHGMGDLGTCSACHAPDYCVGCHGIPLPHAPNYLSVHGDDVLAMGKATCTTCHQEASCDSCHGGVPMPHPASFLESHKDEVETSGQTACERCHAESSCTNCHERHIHPGLLPERLKGLEERPVSVQ